MRGIDRGKIDEQKGIACDECVESCPAVESCRQCVRNLCVQCGDHHRRSKTTNMHTLVSLAEQHEDKMHRAAFCAEHDDQRLAAGLLATPKCSLTPRVMSHDVVLPHRRAGSALESPSSGCCPASSQKFCFRGKQESADSRSSIGRP